MPEQNRRPTGLKLLHKDVGRIGGTETNAVTRMEEGGGGRILTLVLGIEMLKLRNGTLVLEKQRSSKLCRYFHVSNLLHLREIHGLTSRCFSGHCISNEFISCPQILAVLLHIHFIHKEIYEQYRLVIYRCSITRRLESLFRAEGGVQM
jgi:hypothetical protein